MRENAPHRMNMGVPQDAAHVAAWIGSSAGLSWDRRESLEGGRGSGSVNRQEVQGKVLGWAQLWKMLKQARELASKTCVHHPPGGYTGRGELVMSRAVSPCA